MANFPVNRKNQENSTKMISERTNFVYTDKVKKEDFYTFQDNNTVVFRFLPPWSREGVIFKRMETYWFNIDNVLHAFCSPTAFDIGDPFDAIKMEIFRNKNWKDKYLDDIKKLNGRIGCATRVLVGPSFDRAMIAVCPSGLADSVNVFFGKDDYGDITDIQNGYNFEVKTDGVGMLRKYSLLPVLSNRDMSNNPAYDSDLDLDTIYAPPPRDVVLKCFLTIQFDNYRLSDRVKKILAEEYGYDPSNVHVSLPNNPAPVELSVENPSPEISLETRINQASASTDPGTIKAEIERLQQKLNPASKTE